MDNDTQLVRDRAYQIWLREGQPTDRHAEHWRQAEEEMKAEPAQAGGPAESHAAVAAGSIGPAGDAAGAFAGSIGPSDNNGAVSAEPGPLSDDRDATRDPDDHSG